MKRFVILTSALFLLSNCSTNEAGKVNKSTIGAIGGGVAGALIGSTIGKGYGKGAAIIAGTVLGSLAGSALGKSLDERDLELQKSTQYNALEYNKAGDTSSWQNPDSKASGYVTPTKTFINREGQNCREYTQTIKIGSKTEEGFGTACRRSDGSWEIVK